MIVKILNLRIIKEDDFTESETGNHLTKEATKVFLNNFEAELERRTRRSVPSLKDQIYLQIIRIKQFMLKDEHLTFYRWKG